jgi:hypothetical protein
LKIVSWIYKERTRQDGGGVAELEAHLPTVLKARGSNKNVFTISHTTINSHIQIYSCLMQYYNHLCCKQMHANLKKISAFSSLQQPSAAFSNLNCCEK